MAAVNITAPRQLVFGDGSLENLGTIAGALGRSAYVMIYSAPDVQPLKNRLTRLLDSSDVSWTFDESVASEPSVQIVDAAAESCRASGADLIISVGGGSVIDCAKLVAMLQTNPGSSRDYQMGERTVSRKPISHIAIPTTAGTGSEGTKVAVLTNKEAGIKKSIADPSIVPDAAMLDSKLTVSLPPRLTALTGMDALSHAVESYVSLNANPVTEAFGMKAVELIGRSLRVAVEHGTDIEARSDVLMASYLAGVSLNAGVGAAHILAQPLGAVIGTSHSEAISAVLAPVVEANWRYSVAKYADIARALEPALNKADDEDAAGRCAGLIGRLCDDIGASCRLGSWNLDPAGFASVLESVSKSTGHIKCNPRPVDDGLLTEILNRAL